MTQEVVLSDGLVFYCGEGSCSWAQLREVINIRKLTSTQLGQLGDTPAGLVWANANILESLVALYGRHRAAKEALSLSANAPGITRPGTASLRSGLRATFLLFVVSSSAR